MPRVRQSTGRRRPSQVQETHENLKKKHFGVSARRFKILHKPLVNGFNELVPVGALEIEMNYAFGALLWSIFLAVTVGAVLFLVCGPESFVISHVRQVLRSARLKQSTYYEVRSLEAFWIDSLLSLFATIEAGLECWSEFNLSLWGGAVHGYTDFDREFE